MIKALLGWLKRTFLRPQPTPPHDDDPYTLWVLREVYRTGDMVMGETLDNGDLLVTYRDGDRVVVTKGEVYREFDPRRTGDGTV